MNEFKISICTVCMNRLHHIKQTLPLNIEDNKDYQNLEFIILDYNSSDGLNTWIKSEMSHYIQSGILKYYRTEEPLFFDRTHSRNLMFKLATGDVLSNVDADNFTGKGFARYLNDEFVKNPDIYVVADTKKRFYFLRNAFGRFACNKQNYLLVGGMDETMKSYGSETLDLYERFEQQGLEEVVIKNINFLKAISHDDSERIENEYFLKNIHSLFIRFKSFELSEVIFLFKDNYYEACSILPEKEELHLPATLKPGSLNKGKWIQRGIDIVLEQKIFTITENGLQGTGYDEFYYKITDPIFLQNVAKNYSFIVNNAKLRHNKLKKNIKVNSLSFGLGNVTLNFDTSISII